MAYTDLLATTVVQGVLDDLADVSTLPQNLLFVNRIPSVEADDGEIMARYTGRVYAAEIIMDDQKAVIRASRPIRTQTTDIPKIKHGILINESMQNVLRRIESNRGNRRDFTVFEDYVARTLVELRQGVFARMESMLVAMAVDAFSYDRMGIKISNASWGMPSDIKVTPATLWTNAAAATPINDILSVVNVMQQKYGITVNRITMSTQAFNYLIATDEFRNKSALYAQLVGVNVNNFPTADRPTMQALASRMLNGIEIEFYDAQVWVENADGTETSSRYLPANKIVLGFREADNNTGLWDWANGVLNETMPGRVPLMIGGGFDGERSGPIAYATAADPHGNPPGEILWSAARGFPRKHKETTTGVLTVF